MEPSAFSKKLGEFNFFKNLLEISASRHKKIYPVGGCIRDFIMGREIVDIDIAVGADPFELARDFADSCGGSFVLLDDFNQIARVVLKTGETIDFSLLRGSIEEDLLLRDFTINAVAYDLYKGLFVDPVGGSDNIGEKIIRCVSEESFFQDPLRILRAVRFAAQLKFGIEVDTKRLMSRFKDELVKVSPERIRDEWFKILNTKNSFKYIKMADKLGLMEVIFPIIKEMKGLQQNPFHKYDVWTHSLETLAEVENIFKSGFKEFGCHRKKLISYFGEEIVQGRNRYALTKMGCLFHDISKPECCAYIDGKVTFFGHNKAGAKAIGAISNHLHLGKREAAILQSIVLNHLRPVFLGKSNVVTPRALYRFFRDTSASSIDTLILSWADVEAGRGPALTADIINKHHDFVKSLIEKYFQESEVVKPPRWVGGDDLIKIFGMKEGSLIGDILSKLDEASATGQIKNRDEALAMVRELLTTGD